MKKKFSNFKLGSKKAVAKEPLTEEVVEETVTVEAPPAVDNSAEEDPEVLEESSEEVVEETQELTLAQKFQDIGLIAAPTDESLLEVEEEEEEEEVITEIDTVDTVAQQQLVKKDTSKVAEKVAEKATEKVAEKVKETKKVGIKAQTEYITADELTNMGSVTHIKGDTIHIVMLDKNNQAVTRATDSVALNICREDIEKGSIVNILEFSNGILIDGLTRDRVNMFSVFDKKNLPEVSIVSSNTVQCFIATYQVRENVSSVEAAKAVYPNAVGFGFQHLPVLVVES